MLEEKNNELKSKMNQIEQRVPINTSIQSQEAGISDELAYRFNQIKNIIIQRYKYEKYMELSQEISRVDRKSDIKTFIYLTSEIDSLKYNLTRDDYNYNYNYSLEDIEFYSMSIIEELERLKEDYMIKDKEAEINCELKIKVLKILQSYLKIGITNQNQNQSDFYNELKKESDSMKIILMRLSDTSNFLERILNHQVFHILSL